MGHEAGRVDRPASARLYVGCYTDGPSGGIVSFDATDPEGSLLPLDVFEGIEHPSFVVAHPDGHTLYAVSETDHFRGEGTGGGVVALRIAPDGSLAEIDRAPSLGAAPCHIGVDPAGRWLAVANYVGGSVTALGLADDGSFDGTIGSSVHTGGGPHPRQDGPHAHQARPSPDGTGVWVPDLGTDDLVGYRVGENGLFRETTLAMRPGSGPRHLAWHPTEPVAFVVGELDSTVDVVGFDDPWAPVRQSFAPTLPKEFDAPNLGAEVVVTADGALVLVSNRGHDSLAVFAFDPASRMLESRGYVAVMGRTPRHFAIHPAGRSLLVATQDDGGLAAFSLGAHGALPEFVGHVGHVARATCVCFVSEET